MAFQDEGAVKTKETEGSPAVKTAVSELNALMQKYNLRLDRNAADKIVNQASRQKSNPEVIKKVRELFMERMERPPTVVAQNVPSVSITDRMARGHGEEAKRKKRE